MTLVRHAPVWLSASLLLTLSAFRPAEARSTEARSTGARPADARPTAAADSVFLARYTATRGFNLGRPGAMALTPQGDAVLFLRSSPTSPVQDLYEFDAATSRERVLLTAEQILKGAAEKLSVEERERRERRRMLARGIASFHLSEDGRRILVPLSGQLYVVERPGGAVRELASSAGFPLDPRFSPDAGHVACVRGHDLYVTDVASGAERRLTTAENDSVSNGLAEFVAQEEMDRSEGYWWSPDSRFLAYEHADSRGVERMFISDPAHPERPPQAWPYPRPGKKNVDATLGIVPVAGGPTVWVDWDRARYPYLTTVRWSRGAPLTIYVMNRAQSEAVLLEVDPASGHTRELLTERDPAWINLSPGMPRWLEDGSAFFWISDRDGPQRLELHGRDGKLLRALTPEGLDCHGVVDVDPDAVAADRSHGVAWIAASEEPTESHIYRVPLSGGEKPRRVTQGAGIHFLSFSKNHRLRVRGFSLLSGGRGQQVERGEPVAGGDSLDWKSVGELRSVAEPAPFKPSIELATVGSRGFRTAIVRPRDFKPGRRYPVLVNIYAGPHVRMVQATPDRYLLDQWMADHGYIVVTIDGRGTPGRGRAWERVFKSDYVTIPLADQAEAIQALGARYREMDLSHVGVWGWSGGGYFTAMALLLRPDVFHAGVAGAPVIDWHDYDTFYTERYLGLPDEDPKGYEISSVLTYAPRLSRPLLLVHGTADDNVYLLNTLKFVDALNRAGRPYEFLPLVGSTHMVAEPAMNRLYYGRMLDFFARHLTASTGGNP